MVETTIFRDFFMNIGALVRIKEKDQKDTDGTRVEYSVVLLKDMEEKVYLFKRIFALTILYGHEI